MSGRRLIPLLLLTVVIFLAIPPVMGAEVTEKKTLYQSDFSAEPGWTTNSPTRYYWDPTREMYHFLAEGGTNGYSFVPIDYGGDSFTLEYDITIVSITKDSAAHIGITSSEMDISRGTNVLSNFEYNKYGRMVALRVIDQNNHLHEATSFYESYCKGQPGCDSRFFDENKTYHITLRYNKALQNADMKVVEKETGEQLWGYYVDIGQDLFSMTRLAITTKGDYAFGPTTEGYLDNIELSALVPVTPTPTSTLTKPVITSTTPETTVPTTAPTPTQSPISVSTILAAVGILAGLFLVYNYGKE